jgi:hypothetical protein
VYSWIQALANTSLDVMVATQARLLRLAQTHVVSGEANPLHSYIVTG